VLSAVQEMGDVILFIDEMHTLIGAGSSSEGSLDAANLLKPALARGQVRVIGATTYKEYRKYIEKDAALARRFQRIDVREPDRDETLQILRGLRARYEEYHHVTIAEEALLSAVELSARYVTDRSMPDKAIDLIDEAASMAKLAIWHEDSELSEVVIRSEQVARVISQWTGVPVERIGADNQQDILNLESRLLARIVGQNDAVASIARALRRSRAGLGDPTRPLGVFMLLGPSGVGKTELCKALSEALFGSEEALIRIDMSEYSEEATASRLIGSPPGYVGHGEGGQLTDAVLKRPYSVVLFDEIEKAHPKIFSLLLQLLDDGHLTDSVGRRVNFKNTVIMMTTNVGVSYDMDKAVGFAQERSFDLNEKRSKSILAKARQVFRPEFLGRIDEMVIMNALDHHASCQISERILKELYERLSVRGIEIHWTQAAVNWLAEHGVDAMSGARNLKKVIRENVEDPLCDLILSSKAENPILIDMDNDGIALRVKESICELV